MKRTSRSKPEGRVLPVTLKVKKVTGQAASAAQRRVKDKGEWVAGKVNRAMDKIERMIAK